MYQWATWFWRTGRILWFLHASLSWPFFFQRTILEWALATTPRRSNDLGNGGWPCCGCQSRINLKLKVDETVVNKSKGFWQDYTLIRPVIYSRYQNRTRSQVIGFHFSDRHPEAYACAVIGHWLNVYRKPWLKICLKFIDGGFCYQWEPMHVTLQSVIMPEVVFYVFQRGLIFQDQAWWTIRNSVNRVTVCLATDERQNCQFLNAFAQAATNNEVV